MKISQQEYKWVRAPFVDKVRLSKAKMTGLESLPFEVMVAGKKYRSWSMGTAGFVSLENKAYYGKLNQNDMYPPLSPLIVPFGEWLNPFG